MSWHKLEELVLSSHRDLDIYAVRIKTRMTRFKGDNEIADFYTFYKGNLFYLEVKSTKGTTFPFSMVQPNQAIGINKASKYENIQGGFIVGIKDNTEIFYIDISIMDSFLKKGKVSLNRKELIEHGIELKISKTLQFDKLYDIIITGGK